MRPPHLSRTTRPALLPLLLAALLLLLLSTPSAEAADPVSSCRLSGTTGWTDEGQNTDYNVFQRPTGTKRVIMLFVDFPDAAATETTSSDAAQLTPVADWMWKASYGKTWLSISRHNDWLRMPKNSTDYGYERGLTHEEHEAYIKDAVNKADPKVDFSQYDMVYVVATKNAQAISFTPTYVYAPGTTGIRADGTTVKWAVTFGQDMWDFGPKVAAHETGHTFGLPDLYSFDSSSDIHRYIGGWDVMGNVSGKGPQFFAWHSWKLGWTADDQVLCRATAGTDTVYLSAVEYTSYKKMAVIKTGANTAYVVESRRAVHNDENACSTGALVYKVDTSVKTGEGPIRVMDAKPNDVPKSGCHPLDDAPYWINQSFEDSNAGVKIEVTGADGYGETVRITKS
ncbi:M6 family metalloprotease domain-containing protein [Streptomyces sp. NPDC020681]|uniref:M6 family metalloprotease domain-containing protein n=1 Tax=Streptomyces sp. NPDC020681 TaxID=3365083 RepID=UPI003791651C